MYIFYVLHLQYSADNILCLGIKPCLLHVQSELSMYYSDKIFVQLFTEQTHSVVKMLSPTLHPQDNLKSSI